MFSELKAIFSLAGTRFAVVVYILVACLVRCDAANAHADTLSTLPEWKKGYLDIHHINTTRGNACFIVCPDGTTMLIDAGDMDVAAFNKQHYPLKANGTRMADTGFSAGRYIADYIAKAAPADFANRLDYALITHFHQDHYGKVKRNTPSHPHSPYKLTGITEVASIYPISTLIDRAYPHYDFPVPLKEYYTKDSSFQNYLAFVDHYTRKGTMKIEALKPGSSSQVKLVHTPTIYPSFIVQNIKCNNTIWSGKDTGTQTVLATEALFNDQHKFDENPLSLAVKISYGAFSYYSGGDNTGITEEAYDKLDVETGMAAIIGDADVMTLDHHGNRDANNAAFVEALSPKVIIGQTWCSDHIGQELAFRLFKAKNGKPAPDVYSTYMHEEAKVYLGSRVARGFKNLEGHTMVRVHPDGQFYVFILQEDGRAMIVTKQFGPYTSQ